VILPLSSTLQMKKRREIFDQFFLELQKIFQNKFLKKSSDFRTPQNSDPASKKKIRGEKFLEDFFLFPLSQF